MSAKVVTPPRICSAAASRVPQRTKSSVTFFASAGKIYFFSHTSSVTSSFRQDRIALDRNRAILQNAPLPIHRNDHAARHQQVHFFFLRRLRESQRS